MIKPETVNKVITELLNDFNTDIKNLVEERLRAEGGIKALHIFADMLNKELNKIAAEQPAANNFDSTESSDNEELKD